MLGSVVEINSGLFQFHGLRICIQRSCCIHFWGVSASCAVGDSSGKVTNVVISFWILLTLISPFNRVTIFLQIANPSPFREFLPFISKESNILQRSNIFAKILFRYPFPELDILRVRSWFSTFRPMVIFPSSGIFEGIWDQVIDDLTETTDIRIPFNVRVQYPTDSSDSYFQPIHRRIPLCSGVCLIRIIFG